MKIVCTEMEFYSLHDRCNHKNADCNSCALCRICGENGLDDIDFVLTDRTARPMVNLSGRIRYGLTEEQIDLLIKRGIDPDGAVILRDDPKETLVRSKDMVFVIRK